MSKDFKRPYQLTHLHSDEPALKYIVLIHKLFYAVVITRNA